METIFKRSGVSIPNSVSALEGQPVFTDFAASTRRMINAKMANPVMLSPLRNVGRPWPLGASMLAAVACVALLAYWDARRESEAALADFAQEQQTLAVALAMDVRDRLHVTGRRASLVEILQGLRLAQRPSVNVIALLPPGGREFVTSDGAPAALDSLRGELWRVILRPDSRARRLPR